jgi:hypothetical protein
MAAGSTLHGDAIDLAVTAGPDELLAASNIMAYRHAGRARMVASAAFVAVVGIAFGLGMAWLTGVMILDGALISLYAVLGTLLAFIGLRFRTGRSHKAAFSKSTLRNMVVPVRLDPVGLTFGVRALDLKLAAKFDAYGKGGEVQKDLTAPILSLCQIKAG